MSRILPIVPLLMLWCMTQPLFSQGINVGRPLSTHFSKETYGGGTQNWDFDQDKPGRLFVANNNGLMIFDGMEWKVLPLPNRTILRSVKVGPSGSVFVGGQGILGYFSEQANRTWVFEGLNEAIPEADRVFGDVWDIAFHKNACYFRTTDKVFKYEEGKITTLFRGTITYCLRAYHGELYLHDKTRGLLRLENDSFQGVKTEPVLAENEITDILPLEKDALLIVSIDRGLFVWKDQALGSFNEEFPDFFRQNEPLAAACLPNGDFAIGTADAGLAIIRPDGKIRYQLDKQNGLQNSRIRSLFTDHSGNLWAGLENGIDMIHTRSPFSYFYPDGDLESPAYAVRIVDNKLYVGMASGLFQSTWQDWYSPFSRKAFTKLPGSEGQVWGLYTVDGQLRMGHHEGAFAVQGQDLQPLGNLEGVWCFNQIRQKEKSLLLAGHYTGLSYWDAGQKTWQPLGNFTESSRFVEQDNQRRIWISHPYRGVYMFDSLPDEQATAKLYDQSRGLPSINFNHIFKIHGELLVAGEKGIYAYEASTDSFILHPDYNSLFDHDERIIRLVEDSDGNIWFITDRNTGLIEVMDQGIKRSLRKRLFPEIHGKLVAGFEHIYPYDGHNVFFAATKGLIHLDPSREVAPDSSWSTWLKAVHILPGDSLSAIHGEEEQQYSNEVNGIRFTCAASSFEEPGKLRFRFRLKGLDDNWSSWSEQGQKEYNNLSSGSYTLEYEAISATGIIKSGKPHTFYIAPPWYATKVALGAYGALGLVALLALIYVPQRAFKKEKAYLETVHKRKEASHQRELEQTEQALANLEKERLQDEVRYKTSELASTTMHLVQKNQLLIKLNTELEQLTRKTENQEVARELKKLIRMLASDIRLDDDWEQFSHHFDQVHRDFVSRLIEEYPQLTPNDHRLCAYLRMNLSSKEIAPLMNISVRGVEVSRYRLRKKLELASEVNLTEFMMRY